MRTSLELCGVGFQIADAVPERRWTAAQIDSRIPKAIMGHSYTGRKHFKMPAVIVVRPAALEVLKVAIAHDPHVALVRAFNDNNVSSAQVFTIVDETQSRPF